MNNINWITVWLSFLFGVLFTMLFRYLNVKSRGGDQRRDAGLPLSGWVVFLGCNLVLRVFIQAYFFLDAHYFLRSTWVHLQQAGGVRFHTLFLCELFLSLLGLTGTGALLFWYYARRDIFPLMFVCYAVFYMLAAGLLMIIYRNMPLPSDMITLRHHLPIQLARLFYILILLFYVVRSKQVRRTFVYPLGR